MISKAQYSLFVLKVPLNPNQSVSNYAFPNNVDLCFFVGFLTTTHC